MVSAFTERYGGYSPASTFSASERVNPSVAVTSSTSASRTAIPRLSF